MMNTAELLNESRGAAYRSVFDRPDDLTSFDPGAHRHAVEIDATFRVSGRELRAQGCRLRSLSIGGAVVEVGRLPVGTLINLTFSLPSAEKRLSLDAIVHCCSRDGVCLLFDSPRGWELGAVWRYLMSLDEGSLDVACFDNEFEPTEAQLANRSASEF